MRNLHRSVVTPELPLCARGCGKRAPLHHEGENLCVEDYRSTEGSALTTGGGSDSIAIASPPHLTLLRFEESAMPENGTIAYVNTAKKCDFPHAGEEVRDAEYDFRTVSGQWANGCEPHYLHYRMHNMLGLGKGQKLVTRPDIVGPVIPNGGEVPPNSHDSSDLI